MVFESKADIARWNEYIDRFANLAKTDENRMMVRLFAVLPYEIRSCFAPHIENYLSDPKTEEDLRENALSPESRLLLALKGMSRTVLYIADNTKPCLKSKAFGERIVENFSRERILKDTQEQLQGLQRYMSTQLQAMGMPAEEAQGLSISLKDTAHAIAGKISVEEIQNARSPQGKGRS